MAPLVWTTRAATRAEKVRVGLPPKATVTSCLDHRRSLVGIVDGTRPLWVAPTVDADKLERTMERRLIGWPQPVTRPELQFHNIAGEILDATRRNTTPRMDAPRWVQPVCKLRMQGHSPKTIRAELFRISQGEPTHSPLCRELLMWINSISDARAEA